MRYITGSTGFIGSHLIKQLDNVTAIPHDKISSIKLKPYDYFYFLSSYGNLASQTDEDLTYKANVEDLMSILKQSKTFKSFVYMSTSSVSLKTQTTYSRCKKASEELLLAYMEKRDLPVCIIRPFSVTGVGEQKEHLIPTLIDCAYTGKMINIDPSPTHDFIDVEDIVEGIKSLSNNHARGIYQLGTGIKTTNLRVLQIVEHVTGRKIQANYVTNVRPYDNDNWVSTNFKARMYGWLPKKSLEDSIKEMVKEYVK